MFVTYTICFGGRDCSLSTWTAIDHSLDPLVGRLDDVHSAPLERVERLDGNGDFVAYRVVGDARRLAKFDHAVVESNLGGGEILSNL